ncbi:phage tail protein [Enterovirga sp.]|uniref:phage tail protein n=1 Tax=Enterovirga sp. TaxID=2026350 RepID=UPI002C71CF68|nr:phage tail protein [Enterovirga sp.]HMO30288.1 phage tail protein [Enterovirga sp.]
MAATDARNDPFRAFNYEVDFGDKTSAGFSEVSGLTADGDPVDYREGTDPFNHVRRLTGLRKYTNIKLIRGYTRNDKLWQWYEAIANGKNDRRDIIITLKDEEHKPVLRWTVVAAWVNKIEGPSLKAAGNDIALESVEICHEGIHMQRVGAA